MKSGPESDRAVLGTTFNPRKQSLPDSFSYHKVGKFQRGAVVEGENTAPLQLASGCVFYLSSNELIYASVYSLFTIELKTFFNYH